MANQSEERRISVAITIEYKVTPSNANNLPKGIIDVLNLYRKDQPTSPLYDRRSGKEISALMQLSPGQIGECVTKLYSLDESIVSVFINQVHRDDC